LRVSLICLKSQKKEETIKVEEEIVEEVKVDGNPYVAKNFKKIPNFWYVYLNSENWGYGGPRPIASIQKSEDGKFLLRDPDNKKVKVNSIERALNYLYDEQKKKESQADKPDIDLTEED
jgi:hypothetical protein